MIRRKLLLFFCSVLLLNCGENLAQTSQDVIILNEYSATNITGPTDNFGAHSDWVEIRCAHTASVSMSNYYLSNDRNNLNKWKFPTGFVMQPNDIKTVWLTGKNISSLTNPHANFTLDQCRDQWLIISENGVIRDSVVVQVTKADHTRGRINPQIRGIGAWRLYTTHSNQQNNPLINNYIDYAPTPEIYVSTETDFSKKPNQGGFYPGAQILFIRLNGMTYDTLTSPCFNVFYTLSDPNGLFADYPVEGYPPVDPTVRYYDSLTSFITIDRTTIVRAIAVANPLADECPGPYLPSFCETNTYFINDDHQAFDPKFGVVSLAFDRADTSWFTAQGNPPSTTIHVEYYDNKKQLSEGYAIINKPPQEEWLTKQRGFYIEIDDKRGFGCNFEGNIFNVEELGTTTRTVFPSLHLKAGDMESHSLSNFTQGNISFGTGLRDVFMQSLAAKNNLNVNPLHIKPVVSLKNGAYWGAFNFFEVYDKYYESYYKGQSPDSLDLLFVDNGTENWVTYPDGTGSLAGQNFRTEVYDPVLLLPIQLKSNYDKVMAKLDKSSFIDYMITNSFAMNSDLWRHNIAFAKGKNTAASGGKWHYYLWNMPTIFNFTEVAVPQTPAPYNNPNISPCIHFATGGTYYPVGGGAYSGHGNILRKLMNTPDNAGQTAAAFQNEFRNRYQDLMNGPFKCENLLKHYETIYALYAKEMKYHEDPANIGGFFTEVDQWDTNMVRFRRVLETRCYVNESYFSKPGCFGTPGPYPLTVDVRPAGAGTVKLNTTVLNSYLWSGNYYRTTLSFKAIPTNTTFAFHHWEFATHTPKDPESMDSVGVVFAGADNVVAVFTDKSVELGFEGEGANIPTGFTPNGDGINDDFRPLGAGEFAGDYQMTIWNRWGQEVFRSVDPLNGWDGYFKGQQALTGVYAYIITYKNVYGESKVVKGNVTLTR